MIPPASPIARLALAALAGLLLAASFPKWNLAVLAWIAPGFLLGLARDQPARRRFLLGYVAGLAHYLASLHWLLFIPFPAGAIAGWIALSAYLSLYPACWVWLCWALFPQQNVSTATPNPGTILPPHAFPVAWWRRAGWALLCAAAWVTMEMIVGRFLSGFPWNFLGASQYRAIPLIQMAAFTGIHGVSFVVVWISVSLFLAVRRLSETPGRRHWMAELRLPLAALLVLIAAGFQRAVSTPPPARHLKLALIQPSIPQELIWDRREDSNRFATIMRLSEQALSSRPDLLVWPEAAMPAFSEDNFRAIIRMIGANRIWMVLGADDTEPRPGQAGPDAYDYYNAAFLLNPDGFIAATYRKQRLVIFGEYIPLERWVPFMRHLTPVESGFTAGRGPVPFLLPDPRAEFSVLICFEDVFPQSGRQAVGPGTDFLLNLTNDGWFGKGAAHWQQAATAVFRAVENGVPLVRCTNNGLTCWIDSRGRMREVFRAPVGGEYGAGHLTVDLPLADANRRERTFYWRHGEWFGWSCVAVTAAAGLGRALRGRKRGEFNGG